MVGDTGTKAGASGSLTGVSAEGFVAGAGAVWLSTLTAGVAVGMVADIGVDSVEGITNSEALVAGNSVIGIDAVDDVDEVDDADEVDAVDDVDDDVGDIEVIGSEEGVSVGA